jgi:hypothetical protein
MRSLAKLLAIATLSFAPFTVTVTKEEEPAGPTALYLVTPGQNR